MQVIGDNFMDKPVGAKLCKTMRGASLAVFFQIRRVYQLYYDAVSIPFYCEFDEDEKEICISDPTQGEVISLTRAIELEIAFQKLPQLEPGRTLAQQTQIFWETVFS